MLFLDPKNDVAFKKLFGDVTHKNVLMSFLNSVLERPEGKQIIDVTVNDPNNVPDTPLTKLSIVDVRCTDQANNQYIIEMQVVLQKDYVARAQYYSALALSRQLAKGDEYTKLVPVIFVGVLDFNLMKGEHYLSHHLILDNKTYDHEFKHFEFHFIELEKFNKTLYELQSMLDKWLYFLRYAATFEKIPTNFEEPVLRTAFDILAQSTWSKKELEAYDRYLDLLRQRVSERASALEEGRAEGRAEEKLNLAKQLLGLLDLSTIAQKTGLNLEEVEKLAKGQH